MIEIIQVNWAFIVRYLLPIFLAGGIGAIGRRKLYGFVCASVLAIAVNLFMEVLISPPRRHMELSINIWASVATSVVCGLVVSWGKSRRIIYRQNSQG